MSDEKNPKVFNVDNLTLFISGRPIIGLSPGKPCARCGDRNWGNSYGGDLCPICEGIKAMTSDRIFKHDWKKQPDGNWLLVSTCGRYEVRKLYSDLVFAQSRVRPHLTRVEIEKETERYMIKSLESLESGQ